ncbi:FadR/GntR family transcriptional regulator [Herbaspirillum robiniae]|uniref:FadR/GntR family transcriptional regulator n=1 Tax=Herbaspirillum robiniae TaxID=2014887 RepID=UPI003D7798D4
MSMAPRRGGRQKLSDLIVEDVKRWIVSEKKQPGDKLPNEKELIELFGYSKSTVREALKALEVQGLVYLRTGPAGGAYIQKVTHDHASASLRNFLHFHSLNGHDIYQLRKILEPELAVSVVGFLSEKHLERLEENIRFCSEPVTNSEELRAHREAELAFHSILAECCPNPVLAFSCRFLNELLTDLMVYKNALDSHEIGKANVDYHTELVAALRHQDKDRVRRLMTEHMQDAESHMGKMEAVADTRNLMLPLTQQLSALTQNEER